MLNSHDVNIINILKIEVSVVELIHMNDIFTGNIVE